MSLLALIGLVDVNAMFASCAQVEDPSLRGLPLLVAGDPSDRRSIVLTASYAARAFGVRTAMPVRMALRLCPKAVIVAPDHGLYRRYSRMLFGVLEEFTPAVQPVSIDEAFLDLTGCPGLRLGETGLGLAIRERVQAATGLSVSVGLAGGRWLAKMAADLAKRRPGGVLHLRAQDVAREVWPLPIEAFYGVGPKTAARLRALGIATIGDLARAPQTRIAPLGQHGHDLSRLAKGEDSEGLRAEEPARSISHELTFAQDIAAPSDLQPVLLGLSDQVAHRLRREGFEAGGIALRLRSSRFQNFSRQLALPAPVQRTDAVHGAALRLLARMPAAAFPARLAGVAAIRLRPAAEVAPELFPEEGSLRREKLAAAIAQVRQRFGEGAVLPAATLKSPVEESYDRRRHGSSFGRHAKEPS